MYSPSVLFKMEAIRFWKPKMKTIIWSVKSSPVRGSALHTVHGKLQTAPTPAPVLFILHIEHYTHRKLAKIGLKMVVAQWTLIYTNRTNFLVSLVMNTFISGFSSSSKFLWEGKLKAYFSKRVESICLPWGILHRIYPCMETSIVQQL